MSNIVDQKLDKLESGAQSIRDSNTKTAQDKARETAGKVPLDSQTNFINSVASDDDGLASKAE